MSSDVDAAKLKRRLSQWEAYTVQPAGDPAAPPLASPPANSTPALAWSSDLLPSQREQRQAAYSPEPETTQYEQQIARLQAELEQERKQAQVYAIKLGEAVLRHKELRDKSPATSDPLPLYQQSHKKRDWRQAAFLVCRRHLSVLVIGTSILIAVLCSVLALLLGQ